MTSPEKQSKTEQPNKEQTLTEQEDLSRKKEERFLDYLMEALGRSFKEIGRMIIKGHASVEIGTNSETGINSALVKKAGKIIYSTSNEEEITALELLSRKEKYAIEYFMSKEPEDHL